MSLKHAILGFLSYQPLSGYDLKKAFDRSVQHFWPANQSQIYRTLAEMEAQGLVEKEVIPREERLDLKMYNITEAGSAELHQWLATPLPTQDYREAFLIQVYFGGKLSDEELLTLLQHEIEGLEEKLAICKSIYEMYLGKIEGAKDPRALFLSVATLEYGILSNRCALDWLKGAVERVRDRDYTLEAF